MKLVLASNNAKKLTELTALFGESPLQLVGQGEWDIPEADEPHGTFVENALAKARHAARATGEAAIADDSGLCVDALDGAPGVVSSHAAGVVPAQTDREATRQLQDAANNAWLLGQLAAQAAPGTRRARFVSVLVALRSENDPEPLIAFGRWEAEILHQPRGVGGFGYDPLVYIASLGATVAELSMDQKNQHSHRALAAVQMRQLMRDVWRL